VKVADRTYHGMTSDTSLTEKGEIETAAVLVALRALVVMVEGRAEVEVGDNDNFLPRHLLLHLHYLLHQKRCRRMHEKRGL